MAQAMAGTSTSSSDRAIRHFDGNNRFLSNFYLSAVTLDGMIYKSVEHAYQAAKTNDPEQRKHIREKCSKPGEAKRYGRTVTIRPDWDSVRLTVMLDLLQQKFCWLMLRDKLLATGYAELIEGNDWHDRFWGVDSHSGKGQNHLGKLLMQVREELRSK